MNKTSDQYPYIRKLYDCLLEGKVSIDKALELTEGMADLKTMEEKNDMARQIVESIGMNDRQK